MSPEEAERGYREEWPALNERKEKAIARGDIAAAKVARQLLGALSCRYSDRHIVEPEQPTLEAQIRELQIRLSRLESKR